MQLFFDNIQDKKGNAIVGADVLVTDYPSGAASTIYSANDPIPANEITSLQSDARGLYQFYALDGRYSITIKKNTLTLFVIDDFEIAESGSGGGGVQTVVGGTNVVVDDSNPLHPIVSVPQIGGQVESVVGGTNVTVDDTDPANPIVNATGGGGGGTLNFENDGTPVLNSGTANFLPNFLVTDVGGVARIAHNPATDMAFDAGFGLNLNGAALHKTGYLTTFDFSSSDDPVYTLQMGTGGIHSFQGSSSSVRYLLGNGGSITSLFLDQSTSGTTSLRNGGTLFDIGVGQDAASSNLHIQHGTTPVSTFHSSYNGANTSVALQHNGGDVLIVDENGATVDLSSSYSFILNNTTAGHLEIVPGSGNNIEIFGDGEPDHHIRMGSSSVGSSIAVEHGLLSTDNSVSLSTFNSGSFIFLVSSTLSVIEHQGVGALEIGGPAPTRITPGRGATGGPGLAIEADFDTGTTSTLLAFFGANPVIQQTFDSSDTDTNRIAALEALIEAYGLGVDTA